MDPAAIKDQGAIVETIAPKVSVLARTSMAGPVEGSTRSQDGKDCIAYAVDARLPASNTVAVVPMLGLAAG